MRPPLLQTAPICAEPLIFHRHRLLCRPLDGRQLGCGRVMGALAWHGLLPTQHRSPSCSWVSFPQHAPTADLPRPTHLHVLPLVPLTATWEQLAQSIPGVLNIGLWGIPFAGADVRLGWEAATGLPAGCRSCTTRRRCGPRASGPGIACAAPAAVALCPQTRAQPTCRRSAGSKGTPRPSCAPAGCRWAPSTPSAAATPTCTQAIRSCIAGGCSSQAPRVAFLCVLFSSHSAQLSCGGHTADV